ncbi:NAD(P)/FAD-dependent oxidoreductase [Chryseobacterium sp. 09-1422]|uniref:NAD(P)/FAD-dependent oxidoreductase n=1 Tax=Chryseobacterium kimseyorum TaxID=2984028 RepID=A0ABT3I3J4_9FLAO|nr:NAD(P)/FAD-dependent oxidoreductase [Chryseobacterium kimseyorum]MCW3170642.1 NAD(P)/FAD-dependent oxidoreductase [Chryseobacterium kimseyorum]
MNTVENFEVIIVGGSYSGLSAALALARMARKVLIINDGKPCNRFANESHNFLPNDGDDRNQVYTEILKKVLKYRTVRLVKDLAISGKKAENGFTINTQSCKSYSTKKIILATGVIDLLPDIEGFQECWGRSVIHCPYCHGHEYRNKKTVILGNGDPAYHMAGIVLNLTNDLSILTDGKAKFTESQLAVLEIKNVAIKDVEVEKLLHHDNMIMQVTFKDESKISSEVMYAIIDWQQQCAELLAHFELHYTEKGLIKIDHSQRTNVPGIYACGDNSSAMRSIAKAVYTGNLAGAMVNQELVDESFT